MEAAASTLGCGRNSRYVPIVPYPLCPLLPESRSMSTQKQAPMAQPRFIHGRSDPSRSPALMQEKTPPETPLAKRREVLHRQRLIALVLLIVANIAALFFLLISRILRR